MHRKNDTQAYQNQQTMLSQAIPDLFYQTQMVLYNERKATTSEQRLILLIKCLIAIIEQVFYFIFLYNPSMFITLFNNHCALHSQHGMPKA